MNGIARLLTHALTDRGHRYYGVSDYSTFTAPQGHRIPPYQNVTDMTRHAFAETAERFQDAQVGENFYYFTAEKLHGVTFAHALATLESLGLPELAKRGFAAHRKALILNSHLPPESARRNHPPTDGLTPYDPVYWRSGHFDDHKLKLALAALELLERLDTAERGRVFNPATFWSGFKR